MNRRPRLPLAVAAALLLSACAGPALHGPDQGGAGHAATEHAVNAYWRHRLLAYHRAHAGMPWRYGGTGHDGTIDCSAYVRNVYRAVFGVGTEAMPRTAAALGNTGRRLRRGERPRPGDLLYFRDRGNAHAGIYVGEGEFIHASVRRGVTRDRLAGYWARRLRAVRRLPGLPPAPPR